MKDFSLFRIYLLVFLLGGLSGGCTQSAYQRMEERSLPRYQPDVPVMTQFQTVCRAGLIHEPGNFLLTYDWLWDVTEYPTYPNNPPRWESAWCRSLDQKAKITDPINYHKMTYIKACKYPHIPLEKCHATSVIQVPNTGPERGAVNAWPVASMSMDGRNWKSKMIYFHATIVEGDKTPLGGSYRGRFNLDDQDAELIEKISINGREWEHWQHSNSAIGDTTMYINTPADLYKTKIGNYSVMVLANFNWPVYGNAEWVAKRRAFLREWINTFKIEPLPADYVKKTPEEIRRMRDQKIEDAEALQAKHNASRKLRPSERLSAPAQDR